MEAAKPSTTGAAEHLVEQARGDTWSASQLRVATASDIRPDDGARQDSALAYVKFANDRVPADETTLRDPFPPLRWWPVVAIVLALGYIFVGISEIVDPYSVLGTNWTEVMVAFSCAVLLIAGMTIRRWSFVVGTTLIVLGCLPALLVFWLILPPLMAVFVIVGVNQRRTKVIDKGVLFGILLIFVTAFYVAVAASVGTIVSSSAERDLWIPIAVTALVAVLFQPVRARLQVFANRLVYGKRATPYEVLAHFADRVAGTYATEDVLPKMARALQEGTGANRAEVWLRSGERLRLAASSPDEAAPTDSVVSLSGENGLPEFTGVDRAIAVQHQGELLGALTLTKPSGEPMRTVEDELLQDLASQAGLVMRNVGLNQEVLARLEELKASRQRLVAAQDEARRRLERNLHDGAQQHLVALKVQLSLVERIADSDKVKSMLRKVASDADEALEALRDLARGIYPPLLADQGLAAALEAQAGKAPIPVTVHAERIARHSEDVEAAVYFCCLEALQNSVKHANASTVEIELTEKDAVLSFCISDNGGGFDLATTSHGDGLLNMADRLEAIGGTLDIESSSIDGTSVMGQLPV